MNKVAMAAAALIGLVSVAGTHASEKLAQANACTACHSIEKKPGMLGPSYQEVAAKYRGDKGAEAMLIKKVKAGGKGVWGNNIMPPNAHVKDEDIKTLVQWILATK